MATEPTQGVFVPARDFRPTMLPTAMRRVLDVAWTSPLIADAEPIVPG
jgi:hypothetical protein